MNAGISFRTRRLMDTFDNGGDALSHADAHGREAIATTALFHFMNECRHEPCATATEGMTEGNGAAVDV
jgi:hypothetical protein